LLWLTDIYDMQQTHWSQHIKFLLV